MNKVNVLSLFDGIACGKQALDDADVPVNLYLASEVAQDAIRIANSHQDIVQLGDVRSLDTYYLPPIDLLIGGSPCQDLTVLRNGDGILGNKSSLLLDFVRIKSVINPTHFLLENVVPRKREWLDQINDLLGVEGIVINSDRFVPQNRPRVYWTNIPILPLPERPNWQYKFYQYRRTYFRENKSGVCPCLTANMGTGGHNIPLHSLNLSDRLSPEECEELQGLPRGYTRGVCNSRRYRMIGDGWTVPVLSHIFKGLER
jgi:DNA (cytosine-5)-methyltransferase 3A